jgi:tetratricopeptide (TPR) repeat protein
MAPSERNEVFISYSHKDTPWCDALLKVLAPDVRNHRITTWVDREGIKTGDPWFEEILEAIDRARVAVLLVSPSFLESEFIRNEELPRLIEASNDGCTLVWVPLSGRFFDPEMRAKLGPLDARQAIPDPAKPLADLPEDDRIGALLKVCRQIARILNPHPYRQRLPFESIGDLFKGREDSLAALRKRLRDSGAAPITQPLAISGLGGVGKTRLAVEFAHRFKNDFTALLFVSADLPTSLDANLASLCDFNALDLPEQEAPEQEDQKQAVLHWLRENPGWLLILDNVDTPEAANAVYKLLKEVRGGQVLITSRLADWSGAVRGQSLSALTREAAVSFILDRTAPNECGTAGRRSPSPEDDAECANRLAEHLDGLPLALEQAAAYIATKRRTLREYLDEFERNLKRTARWYDKEHAGSPDKAPYPNSLLATWTTTVGSLAPLSRAVLTLAAFLAPDPIPVDLFLKNETAVRDAVSLLDAPPDDTAPGTPIPSAPVADDLEDDDDFTVADALAELSRYSMIHDYGAKTFTVHRMVQRVVRDKVAESGQRDWVLRILTMMNEYMPDEADDARTWPVVEPLRGHTTAVFSWYDAKKGEVENDRELVVGIGRAMNCMGTFFFGKGQYAESESLLRRALEGRERALGPEHPDTLTSVNNLAVLLNSKGDLAAAEPMYRRALEAQERVLGPEHPDTLTSVNNLAVLLEKKGDLAAAEPMYRRALEAQERVLGPEHPSTLTSMGALALLLMDKGDLAAAEPLYRRALEGRERVLGPEHPSTLTSMGALAFLLSRKGDLAAAEPLHRRALEGRERVLGPEHPQTLTSVNNLAGLLESKGDLAAAEPMYRRALEAQERVLGPEHPQTLSSVNNLAGLLYRKGDLAAAEPLYRRALEGLLKISSAIGRSHPNLQACAGNYYACLAKQGRSQDEIRVILNDLARSYGMSINM